jgi:hypothetical protein
MIICRECGHRNPSGTTFCENRSCAAFLEWSGDVQATATERIPPAPAEIPPAPVRGPGWGVSRPRRSSPGAVGLTVRLEEDDLLVEPGGTVSSQVTVRNVGEVVDNYSVQVLGDAAPWTTVDPPSVNLVPEADGTMQVTFSPPRRPDVGAGVRPFRLVATSREDRRATAFADGTVNVGPYRDVAADLRPQVVEGRSGAFEVRLLNRGNVPVDVSIEASDAQQALALRIGQPLVTVPPGGGASATVQARPHNGSLSGPPRQYPLRIVTRTGRDAPNAMDARLVYRPLLPPIGRGWLVLARILLTVLGALMMVLGSFSEWLPGADGTALTYENYVESVFRTETPPPPEGVDSIFVSVGLVPIVLAVFVLLGLASRTGLLTRLAAGFALLLVGGFTFTVANAGLSVGSGLIVVLVGTVVALIGGICAMAGKD